MENRKEKTSPLPEAQVLPSWVGDEHEQVISKTSVLPWKCWIDRPKDLKNEGRKLKWWTVEMQKGWGAIAFQNKTQSLLSTLISNYYVNKSKHQSLIKIYLLTPLLMDTCPCDSLMPVWLLGSFSSLWKWTCWPASFTEPSLFLFTLGIINSASPQWKSY